MQHPLVALGGEAVVTQDTLNELASCDQLTDNNQILGSNDPNSPTNLDKALIVAGDNNNLQNISIQNSLYISGDNNTLSNLTVKGTLFIDPGDDGTISLNNVTASNVIILSGAENGIQLKDVNIESIWVISDHKIDLAPTGNSNFTTIVVSSDAVLDSTQGTWGQIHMARTVSPDTLVQLKGAFHKEIFVSSAGELQALPDATVDRVVIIPRTSKKISLDGPFDVVQVDRNAQVTLLPDVSVQTFDPHYEYELNVAKGAKVSHFYNENFVNSLTGAGAVDLPKAEKFFPLDPNVNFPYYKTVLPSPDQKITFPQEETAVPKKDLTITWTPITTTNVISCTLTIQEASTNKRIFDQDIPVDSTSFTVPSAYLKAGDFYLLGVEYKIALGPDDAYIELTGVGGSFGVDEVDDSNSGQNVSGGVENLVGNTPGNISNGGYAAEQGDYIYYYQSTGYPKAGAIYKMKKDGSERVKLCDTGVDQSPVADINVVGDWVYYRYSTPVQYTHTSANVNGTETSTGYAGSIYKIKTDGTGKTKLSDDNARNISVIDGWIYYDVNKITLYDTNSSPGIYRMKTDGTGKVKLADFQENGFILDISDGYIFYSSHGATRIKLDGSGATQIPDGTFLIYGTKDWLYYLTGDFVTSSELYKTSSDGSQKITLYNGSLMTMNRINLSEDYIYFAANDGTYRVKDDGTSLTKVTDLLARNFSIADDSLYFNFVDNNYIPGPTYRAKLDGSEDPVIMP